MIERQYIFRHYALLLSSALIIASLSGCGRRSGPFEAWIRADEERLWQDAPASAWQTRATAIDADLAPGPERAANAGPDTYIRIALESHPAVRAAEQRVAALAQRIPQVTSLDDPMLEIAPFGDMAETAAGAVGLMTGVSQRFPLGGKLAARGDVAEAEVAAAIADRDAVRIRIAHDVRQAYWSFYEAARALEVIGESQTILDQLAQVADAQYRIGSVTQQDILRATVELAELDAQRMTIERQAASAQSMLNRLMNRPVDAELPHPASVSLDAFSYQLDQLLARAIAHNPELRRITAEIDADRRRERLARLQRIPDLNVSFNYNLVEDDGLSPVANGEDQWWIGFGINLPIWRDRLDGAEREAKLNVLRMVSMLADERNALAFRVRDATLAAETAHRRALLFQDEILPQAQQTIDASLSGYRAGSVDFLTLVSNWRILLEFELMLHETVAVFHRALAELEQALGSKPVMDEAQPPADGEGVSS